MIEKFVNMNVWSTTTNHPNMPNENGSNSWNNAKSQETVISMSLEDLEAEEKRQWNDDSIWNEICKFSKQTTHHGVAYITNTKTHILRR